jgi:hypothetical protein
VENVSPAPVAKGASKSFQLFAAFVFILVAVCLGFYFPLLRDLSVKRPEALAYFRETILPLALGHTAAFLVFTAVLRTGAKGALVFWGVSLAGLAVVGGWPQAKALLLLGVMAALLMSLGSALAKLLLPENSRGWAVSLGMGMLAVSVLTSYLAWVHLLKWWILAPLLLSSLIPHARSPNLISLRVAFRRFCSEWNLALALALQGLFLLIVFAYVYAVAPEMQSDALRCYWPYVRLMRIRSGFVDVPQMWSYIIPQAGLAYAASVMTLFRERVLQLSSFLVWLTLLGVVCRSKGKAPLEVKVAMALLVGSCPIVLWVATSLMQDCFVCMVAVIMALVCLEGETPGTPKFWAAVGACAALGWAAKFSLMFYVLPLAAAALIRSWRNQGFARTAAGVGMGGVCGFFVLLPWLVNSYRLSGNPVFPLLLNVFPAPLWPKGVGFSNLAKFRLPPGPRGWFWWPLDLTYQTSRFVEGYNGRLGLTLVVCLLLLLLVLWKGSRRTRTIVVCSIFGTAGLVSMTAYARYWLAGFWLVALAVPSVLFLVLRPRALRFAFSSGAMVILFAHMLMTAYGHWPISVGWPWDVYLRKVPADQYIENTYKAVEMVRRLQEDRQWTKVWFTNYEAIGTINVQPIEAVFWELKLHAREPRRLVQYLASAGCKYWVVNMGGADAQWIPKTGIGQFFWLPDLLVAARDPIRIYRMRPPEEILRDYDARNKAGTNLLADNGFEVSDPDLPGNWVPEGDAGLLRDQKQAEQGQNCYRLGFGGAVSQMVALPPSVRNLELNAALRSTAGNDLPLNWSIVFRGFETDSAKTSMESWVEDFELQSAPGQFRISNYWKRYLGNKIPVPPQAHYAVLYLEGGAPASTTLVDSVRLEPQP